MTLERIQRKREKGWQMPEDSVYVGRPGKWGNPFKKDENVASELDAALYHALWITCGKGTPLLAELKTLRGKKLVCWCHHTSSCHADTLIALANG